MKLSAQYYVILTVIIWSFFGVVTKLLSEVQMDLVMTIAFFSSSIFNYLYAYKKEDKFPILKDFRLVIVTLFGYAFYWIFYILCVESYQLTNVPVILNYTWPFFTGFFTILIYKRQKFDWVFLVSMLLGISGILILFSEGNLSNIDISDSYFGGLMGICAGASYGYYSAKSSQVKKSDLPRFLFTGAFLSTIVMAIYILFKYDIGSLTMSYYELILAFLIGFAFESLGYVFWTKAQSKAVEEKLDVTKIVSLANYLPLLSLIVLAVFYKDERVAMLSGYFICAVVLIVGSSFVPMISRQIKTDK